MQNVSIRVPEPFPVSSISQWFQSDVQQTAIEEYLSIARHYQDKLAEIAKMNQDFLSLTREKQVQTGEKWQIRVKAALEDCKPLPLAGETGWLPRTTAALEGLFGQLPLAHPTLQAPERFKWLPEDRWNIRLRKTPKIFRTKVKRGLRAFWNGLRKPFGGKPRIAPPVTYDLPVRDLARIKATAEIWPGLYKLLLELAEAINVDYAAHKKWMEAIHAFTLPVNQGGEPQAPAESRIAAWQAGLLARIQELESRWIAAIEKQWDIAGTVELPTRRLREEKVAKISLTFRTNFEKNWLPWKNALAVLRDRWELVTELNGLGWGVLWRSQLLETAIIGRAKRNYLDVFEQTLVQFSRAEALLQSDLAGKSPQVLFAEADKLLETLQTKNLNQCNQALVTADLPILFGELETYIATVTRNWGKSRIGKTGFELGTPLRGSTETFSPEQLVRFEAIPGLEAGLLALKQELMDKIQKIQTGVDESGQVANYNLETATGLLSGEKVNFEEAREVALEGLKRAITLFQERKSLLENIPKEISLGIQKAFGPFAANLVRLSGFDFLFALKIKMAKTRALEKAQRARQKIWTGIRFAVPNAWNYLRNLYSSGKEEFDQLREKFGLVQRKSGISTRLSDFLSETDQSIQKLPHVYQRLFRPEPLADGKLFVARTKELEELKLARSNWEKGGYAPTIVVAESGAGVTSLLNQFLAEADPAIPVIRLEPGVRIFTERELILRLSVAFGMEPIGELSALISAIQALPTRKVVVLEQLERFYLKKIDGFGALKALMLLFSETNRQIFWVASIDYFAWNYLNQAHQYHDYFGYVVELKPLSDQAIREIILKRNSLSGFRLEFQAVDQDLKNQSYLKLPQHDRQEFLKNAFFSDLNKLAQSNLSVSFLFWLRSTEEVKDGVITLSSLKGMDFSFMEHLSAPKLITLQAFLLHGKMTIQYHAIASGWPESNSRGAILLLADDGVLVRHADGFYSINPLLFRQTVKILTDKNFIY